MYTYLVWTYICTYVLFVRDSAVIKSHVCVCVCDCVPFLLPVHPLGVTESHPNPPLSLHMPMPVSSDSPPRPIGRCLYRRVIWRVARYHIPIVLCVCVCVCVCVYEWRTRSCDALQRARMWSTTVRFSAVMTDSTCSIPVVKSKEPKKRPPKCVTRMRASEGGRQGKAMP